MPNLIRPRPCRKGTRKCLSTLEPGGRRGHPLPGWVTCWSLLSRTDARRRAPLTDCARQAQETAAPAGRQATGGSIKIRCLQETAQWKADSLAGVRSLLSAVSWWFLWRLRFLGCGLLLRSLLLVKSVGHGRGSFRGLLGFRVVFLLVSNTSEVHHVIPPETRVPAG